MHRLFNDKMVTHLVFALIFFLLASFSWIQALGQSPLNPWLMSITAAPVVAYCVFRVWQAFKEMERLKLGREGERAVAEQLGVIYQIILLVIEKYFPE